MVNPNSPSSPETEEILDHAVAVAGPRKLVRPKLSEQMAGGRQPARREAAPLLPHHEPGSSSASQGSSHAEIFYLQKQIQAQTEMIFVLDDGERIEGVIEWYDQQVIKVRHTTRTMIYKSSIKYLFKASEAKTRSVIAGTPS